jgi:glycosyltransferase involved in cell wall biosynthesis
LSGILVAPQKYILFIGRIRKYKGVDFLIDTLSNSNIEIPLVIAGQGVISSEINSRVVTINRWLTDSEIHWLILNAEVVVFPYSEASQSGLVPTCISLEKKIVLSDAGALIEQAVYYGSENYFSYPVNSAEGLISAISNALSAPLRKGARNVKDGRFAPEVSARKSGQQFVQKIIKIASQNG